MEVPCDSRLAECTEVLAEIIVNGLPRLKSLSEVSGLGWPAQLQLFLFKVTLEMCL